MRAALGAGTWDLMRPPILEGLLLAVLGGTLGVGIARMVLAVELSRIPADLLGPRLAEARVDARVLAFGLVLALACGVGTALVAALRSCRPIPGETLKQGGPSGSMGQAGLRLQNVFVVIQISAAFILLAGAGLMIRSFLRLDQEKLGFDTSNLLTFNISLPNSLAPDEREIPVLNQLLVHARALPGVASAVLSDSFPFRTSPYTFRVQGGDGDRRAADFHTVSPGLV